MEWLEQWGYATAGMSFLFVGMINFVYGWSTFFASMREQPLRASLVLTNDLLFVIILLELFRTVVNFLKSRVITLEPFLYVGIIAGTRRILTGGMQLIHFEEMPEQLFQRYMWDVGLNVTVVFVLVVGIFLLQLKQHAVS